MTDDLDESEKKPAVPFQLQARLVAKPEKRELEFAEK